MTDVVDAPTRPALDGLEVRAVGRERVDVLLGSALIWHWHSEPS